MAAINPTITYGPNGHRQLALVQWAGVTEADTFVAAEIGEWSDASVQIEGTFGSATVVLQGSNDGTNYQSLTDPQGNAISKTSAAIEQVTEIVRYLKPSHSGGTSESVTVTILARRTP